jgi:PEP-CTERM motif
VYKRAIWTLCMLAATAASLSAESLSFGGSLNTPEDIFTTTFTLTIADTLTFQTWGFGGGTNAAGQAIAAGGFDPLLSLFSGPVATATMVVDGSGDPLADADNLFNPPWSFVGNCPAAGTVAIGTNNDCGDVFMQVTLNAGTYTLVLSDANYIPDAIFDNGALSEGFVDLTDGIFQTCDSDSNACITPNGNYAVDILSTQSLLPTAVPEPSSLPLLCIGLVIFAGAKRFSHRRMSSHL